MTSSLPDCTELLLHADKGVLHVTLNRPHKRNAMNGAMVAELVSVFEAIEQDRAVRAVVLRGAGGHFCAGGDISDMNANRSDESAAARATWEFNRNFGRMITRVNAAPQTVITLLEGAVLGGGFGLACASDVAIADASARFAMPETGLGIIPAQIAPFVVRRIGLTQARHLALLGERIDAQAAYRLGMVHYVVQNAGQLNNLLDTVLKRVRRCAPGANAATKELMLAVGAMEHEQLLDMAADLFSEAMRGAEGQEGTQAFHDKRLPGWAADD